MNLRAVLEPIAGWFSSLGVPAPIVHWGHPAMMGIVIFVLGSYVAWSGWQGRLAADKEVAVKSRINHRKTAPLMTLFLTLGYTGGVLSLVMQQKPILESSHFWTANGVLFLLFVNGAISRYFQGGALTESGDKAGLRMLHAYLGSAAIGLMFLHAALGLRLGLSI